jgi:dTDP-4-dehydrorhamnose reductase
MVEKTEEMKKMKILVTGASGFLGTKVMNILKDSFELTGTYHNKKKEGFVYLDLADRDSTLRVVEQTKPDVILHTASLANVDECELDKEKAKLVNIVGTQNIIEAARKVNAKLVYISTDFVFDGEEGDYKESYIPKPLSFYAKTKLMAEVKVVESGLEYLIIRPEVLYGYNGDGTERSFVFWVYESLKDGKTIKIVNDQFNTPTLVDDIAFALKVLIEKGCIGIYHVAGSERLSRYDMAVKVAETFGFDKSLVRPISAAELKQPAPRPLDSSLNITKLLKEGVTMNSFGDGLKIMKYQMEK